MLVLLTHTYNTGSGYFPADKPRRKLITIVAHIIWNEILLLIEKLAIYHE